MAVCVQLFDGTVLSHEKYLNDVYKTIGLSARSEMFEVKTPFLMNSNAAKCALGAVSNKKRKRSRKYLASRLELLIEDARKALFTRGITDGYFDIRPVTSDELADNNSSARCYSRETEEMDSLISLSKRLQSQQMNSTDLIIDDKNASQIGDLQQHLPCFVHCKSTKPVIVNLMGESFVLPSDSSFLLSDVTEIDTIVKRGRKFDVILLDPPWKNKSVKRKKGYEMLNDIDLLAIPVQQLAYPDCLVAVWTTNNSRQIAFIKQVLFPRWSVIHCSDWHWVKVTQKGEFVSALNSAHKKPYENLILGRYKCGSPTTEKYIEMDTIFFSVPSAVHSHKPPLSEVLKPYLSENAACLEIFARYLLPGWTSCGNEVLKFQHIAHFSRMKRDV